MICSTFVLQGLHGVIHNLMLVSVLEHLKGHRCCIAATVKVIMHTQHSES